MIKSDMLHSLHRRGKYSDVYRIARSLSPDASPIGHNNFFAPAEESMIWFEFVDPVSVNFCPFTGFTWERMSLPVITLARQLASISDKADRLIHRIHMESAKTTNNLMNTWTQSKTCTRTAPGPNEPYTNFSLENQASFWKQSPP